MVAMFWCLQSGGTSCPSRLSLRLQQNRSDKIHHFWTPWKVSRNRSEIRLVFNLMMSRLSNGDMPLDGKALLSLSKETRARS